MMLVAVIALAGWGCGVLCYVGERVAGRKRPPIEWQYPSEWVRLVGGVAALTLAAMEVAR